MIKLKRLNGKEFVLNCDIIETIEKTPDTVINTTNGKLFVVLDTVDEVIDKTIKYKSRMLSGAHLIQKKQQD